MLAHLDGVEDALVLVWVSQQVEHDIVGGIGDNSADVHLRCAAILRKNLNMRMIYYETSKCIA